MGMGNTLMEIALTGPDMRLLCYVPIHEPLLFVLSIALIPLLCCVYNIHIQCKCVCIQCKLYSTCHYCVVCIYSASYTVHATTVLCVYTVQVIQYMPLLCCVYTVQVIQYMPLLCCVYIQCKLYSTCHYCVVCIYSASYTVHVTTVLCVYTVQVIQYMPLLCCVCNTALALYTHCVYSASYTVHATTVLCAYTVQDIQYIHHLYYSYRSIHQPTTPHTRTLMYSITVGTKRSAVRTPNGPLL